MNNSSPDIPKEIQTQGVISSEEFQRRIQAAQHQWKMNNNQSKQVLQINGADQRMGRPKKLRPLDDESIPHRIPQELVRPRDRPSGIKIQSKISQIQELPHSQAKLESPQVRAQPENLPPRITRCPDCNSLLHISYSCTGFTLSWSLFLLIGLTCWVPCVVDACKRSQSRCLTCDKIVQVYEPSCC